MWKTMLNKSVRELRFVLRGGPENDGVWKFVAKRLPELTMLNKNTHFSVVELHKDLQLTMTESSCTIVYGDLDDTEDNIYTSNMKYEVFEQTIKEKIDRGLGLRRTLPESNEDRNLPIDYVEASKMHPVLDNSF